MREAVFTVQTDSILASRVQPLLHKFTHNRHVCSLPRLAFIQCRYTFGTRKEKSIIDNNIICTLNVLAQLRKKKLFLGAFLHINLHLVASCSWKFRHVGTFRIYYRSGIPVTKDLISAITSPLMNSLWLLSTVAYHWPAAQGPVCIPIRSLRVSSGRWRIVKWDTWSRRSRAILQIFTSCMATDELKVRFKRYDRVPYCRSQQCVVLR